jgi:hypothetical protein
LWPIYWLPLVYLEKSVYGFTETMLYWWPVLKKIGILGQLSVKVSCVELKKVFHTLRRWYQVIGRYTDKGRQMASLTKFYQNRYTYSAVMRRHVKQFVCWLSRNPQEHKILNTYSASHVPGTLEMRAGMQVILNVKSTLFLSNLNQTENFETFNTNPTYRLVYKANSIFWGITLCSPLKFNRCYGGKCCLLLQDINLDKSFRPVSWMKPCKF